MKNTRLEQLKNYLEKNGFTVNKENLVFSTGKKPCIMVNTNYDGMYPSNETFDKIHFIENHCKKYYKELVVETRGFYTAVYIY